MDGWSRYGAQDQIAPVRAVRRLNGDPDRDYLQLCSMLRNPGYLIRLYLAYFVSEMIA